MTEHRHDGPHTHKHSHGDENAKPRFVSEIASVRNREPAPWERLAERQEGRGRSSRYWRWRRTRHLDPVPLPPVLRIAEHFRRFMLRTERGWLRPLWALGYAAAMRLFVAYLRRGIPRATAYAIGSLGGGKPVFGLSDIDVALLLPDSGGRAREQVHRRWKILNDRAPLLRDLGLDPPRVYEEADLARVAGATALTYGLDGPLGGESAYTGRGTHVDTIVMLERPGIDGSIGRWRRLSGPERRPPEPPSDCQARRLKAWLELQYWWRWAFAACLGLSAPSSASRCVKFVAEPARIWLWLVHGERTSGQKEALERALVWIPEEEDAFREALAIHDALERVVAPPLGRALSSLVRMSERLARHLAAEVEDAAHTEVRLAGEPGDLVMARGALRPLQSLTGGPTPLPLADWRAVVRPAAADEAFALVPGDATDPGRMARITVAGDTGPYPTLRTAELLIRPATIKDWDRAALRTVQCPVTDPVSFALVEGRTVASFRDVRGWSARDCARRAVAEHRARLAKPDVDVRQGSDALAMLLGAARAGLFLQSVEKGEPELALTLASAARGLAASVPAAASVAEEAVASHAAACLERSAPADRLLAAIEKVVLGLPAYRAS